MRRCHVVFSSRTFSGRSGAALFYCGLVVLAAWPVTPAAASVVDGLTAYWNFQSDVYSNQVGGAANATLLTGTPTSGVRTGASAFVGNALVLNGKEPVVLDRDSIQLPFGSGANAGAGDLGTSFTISSWYWQSSSPIDRSFVFESGGATPANFDVSYGTGGSNNAFTSYVRTTGAGTVTTSYNAWHQVLHSFAYDGALNRTTLSVYVDGTLQGSAFVTGTLNVPRINVGTYRDANGRFLDGMIDDVALWNRSITASEAAAIAGLGRVSGIDLGSSAAIDNVLAMNTLGQSAVAGSDRWYYTNTFATPATGGNLVVGRNYVGTDGHSYLVLGGNQTDGFTGTAKFATGTKSLGYYPMQTDNGAAVSAGQVASRVDDASPSPAWFPGGPYHGTAQNGPTYSNNVPATIIGLDGQPTTRSLSFDGANDYVSLGTPQALLDLPQDAFTVEAWINTTDANRGNILGTYQSATPRGFNFEIRADGKLRAYLQGVNSVGGSTILDLPGSGTVNNGEWRHVAMVYTGPGTNNVRLYIDGQLDLQGTYTGVGFSVDPATPFRIGNDNRSSGPIQYGGLMDQVRVSGEAIAPGHFLIAGRGEQNYYRMETNAGSPLTAVGTATRVDDTGLHPFSYHSTAIIGAPAYSTRVPDRLIVRDGIESPNAYSLAFNGTTDYVTLGNKTLLNTLPADDFTIEFFLKTPERDPRAIIFGAQDYTINLEIGGQVHGSNQGHIRAYLADGSPYNDVWGDTNISDDQWHHVALVRSGAGTGDDKLELYVDYELDGQRAFTLGQYTANTTWYLGRDARTTGYLYEGLLDEFRITRGALEVSQFLVAVPEPGTFVLMLGGLLASLALGRKRR